LAKIDETRNKVTFEGNFF